MRPLRHLPLCRLLCLAVLLLALPAAAQEPQWVEGVDDLPLMPGLVMQGDAPLVFDKPEGRIVQATAAGSLSADAVRAFYTSTMPELGWRSSGGDNFTRAGERLRVQVDGSTAGTTVRFTLTPQ